MKEYTMTWYFISYNNGRLEWLDILYAATFFSVEQIKFCCFIKLLLFHVLL